MSMYDNLKLKNDATYEGNNCNFLRNICCSHKAFVSAVCKMQKRVGSELNADEKSAIQKWLPKPVTLALSANHATTIAELVAQLPGTVDGGGKCKADEISEEYYSNSDDCFDHVIGSAA